ncbi:MAG: 50S ribosomal protein L29 [Bacteroidota bacterium]|mgnify:FL=1|jgi:large subunit ribosomal protein L29|nr:50S ribosomal protein L29 [Chitinophagia bacterium]
MANKKKTNQEDLRSLDEKVLAERLAELKMQLKKLEFNHAVNPIENPLVIRATRRNIARINTEQRRRTLGF